MDEFIADCSKFFTGGSGKGENSKAKVPIILENITAPRVRVKLFNRVTTIYGKQKVGDEFMPGDWYNNKKPGTQYLSNSQISFLQLVY